MFEADRGTAGNRWPVLRLRAGCHSEIVLLSTSFFEVTTHWAQMTVACAGEGCALCEWLPARGLFYVAAMCTGRVHLVELGAQSASHLEQHAKLLHGGMKVGQVYMLTRRSAKSPVHSECTGQRPAGQEVLKIETAARVMALYKYPGPQPGEDLERYDARIHDMAVRRCEALARRLQEGSRERLEA